MLLFSSLGSKLGSRGRLCTAKRFIYSNNPHYLTELKRLNQLYAVIVECIFLTNSSELNAVGVEVRPRQAAVASVLCNMVVVSSLDHALRTWRWICSPPSWLCNRWDGSAAHCQFWWPHQPAVFTRSSWAEPQRLIIGPYCCFIYERHSSQPIVQNDLHGEWGSHKKSLFNWTAIAITVWSSKRSRL